MTKRELPEFKKQAIVLNFLLIEGISFPHKWSGDKCSHNGLHSFVCCDLIFTSVGMKTFLNHKAREMRGKQKQILALNNGAWETLKNMF